MNNKSLQKLVEEVSIQYFDKPFKHKAIFNSRLKTTGGRYFLDDHHLDFNYGQYEVFGKEALIDIIKHELCHYHLHIEGYGYKHRDKDFIALALKVGAPRHCNPLPQYQIYKYIYVCKQCGEIYKRKKRVNTLQLKCGLCHGTLKQRSKK